MTSCSENSPELRRCRPLLGTFVEITARGVAPAALAVGIEAAFAAIGRVHSLLSYHDPASELSRLNREAARRPVRVDDWTCQVLRLAQRIHSASDGCFDPVVAPLLERTGHLPRPPNARRTSSRASLADVILLPGNRVRFTCPLRLDLGGIAKGFAVDRAIDVLRAAGVSAALVNAGGDLRAFGNHAWPIVVRNPTAPGRLHALGSLGEGALATSAVYFSRRRSVAGHWISAIIDPHSRRPWLARASVTVRAPDAATADALTKVLALLGPAQSRTVFDSFDAKGYWLAANGRFRSMQESSCAAA